MTNTRLRTQDPSTQLSGLNARERAIRLHLTRRLTDIQYRRVVLYYGLDRGRPMSQREVAEAEGVAKGPAQRSIRQAKDKLKSDGYLWVLWVLGKHFMGSDPGHSEAPGPHHAADETFTPDELLELMTQRGGRILDSRDENIRWESDRFHPASPYDVEVDDLNDAYENGDITRLDWQVGLVLARADDQNPDGSDEARTELRQKLEWAFGGQRLGLLSKQECDRRVSQVLRSYVHCK